MSLRLKSFIYKYTGLYLATQEELEYLTSKKFWDDFFRHYNHPDNDMRPEDIQGLLIGAWQCDRDYHFARPMSFLRYNNPRWFWKLIAWFVDLYTVIKWDLKTLRGKDP